MLIITRQFDEVINIGDNVTVTVVSIEGGRVKLGITAPDGYSIVRSELIDPNEENEPAERPAV